MPEPLYILMLIELQHVLDKEQLAVVGERLRNGPFVDGKRSAGEQAGRRKNNLELRDSKQKTDELNNVVMGALVRHPVYIHAGLPLKVAAPYYNRYLKGMSYGAHIDDPIMGDAPHRYRSDIAITLFLNSPQEYQGGELSIRTAFGTSEVKLNAGDGVMYPASLRHEVKPVTEGERLVAVTWVQSLIPEAEKRELLYQLYLAREKLLADFPDARSTHQVDQSYTGLVRMWSQV